MTLLKEKSQFIYHPKSGSEDEVIVLSRCLTERCSECSGTYVSTALCKWFKCNCKCHAVAQLAYLEKK